MRKSWQIVGEVFLQCALLVLLVFGEYVLYGIQQGVGQAKVLIYAKPVQEVLASGELTKEEIQKLQLVNEIKRFAVDSIGISPSNSYDKYYDQGSKPILWVITASYPFELKAYEWWFPILGNVSYKGYFKEERAIKAKEELLEHGFDVDLGTVSAWSTLGWFNDPVLSSMLNRSEGGLANLIIHELTHGTIYAKSSVEFNENLASFIGDKGAQWFLKNKYGEGSVELKSYFDRRMDAKIYDEYMLKAAESLKHLYSKMDPESDLGNKEAEKTQLLRQIVSGVDSLSLNNKEGYVELAKNALESKNAFFVDIQMYDAQQELFQNEYDSLFGGNDLRAYLQYLVEKYH